MEGDGFEAPGAAELAKGWVKSEAASCQVRLSGHLAQYNLFCQQVSMLDITDVLGYVCEREGNRGRD